MAEFPGWYWSPGGKESAIFNSAEDVPKGWTNNQAEAFAMKEVPPPETEVGARVIRRGRKPKAK